MAARCTLLRVQNFRNIENIELVPDAGLNVLVGRNGHGKTNLLEALHLCASLQTLRPVDRVRDLIRHGEEDAHATAHFELEVDTPVHVHVTERGKKAKVAGKSARDVSALASRIGVVAFTPEDLVIVRGSPSARRRALDRVAYGLDPSFLVSARAYEKVLASRNRLLKDSYVDERQLDAYAEPFAAEAARVYAARQRALGVFRNPFCDALDAVTASELKTEVFYRSIVAEDDTLSEDEYRNRLLAVLDEKRRAERQRRTTLVGPHLDDLEIQLSGVIARRTASQGETRALVLSWKIAELLCFTEERGEPPILLLDDVSGELDAKRSRSLFEVARKVAAQVFVTTPSEDALPKGETGAVFELSEGALVDKRELGHPGE